MRRKHKAKEGKIWKIILEDLLIAYVHTLQLFIENILKRMNIWNS